MGAHIKATDLPLAMRKKYGIKVTGSQLMRDRMYNFSPIVKCDFNNNSLTYFGWDAVSFANIRIHHMAVHKRRKAERKAAGRDCMAWLKKPTLPCRVTFVRYGITLLDNDNLTSAFKAARDGVADWLGLNDNDPNIVWDYAPQVKCGRSDIKVIITVESIT